MNNNQPMNLSDFLIRVGLWGGLGLYGWVKKFKTKELDIVGAYQ